MPDQPEPAPRSRTVLLVSEPGVDGVFQYVRALAGYLFDHGWTTHLAYSSVRDCPALHEFVATVGQRGGRTLDLRVGNSPCPADLLALWRLGALAREIQPGIIHAHSSKAGVLARLLPFFGIRASYFYTPHAYYQMYGPNGMKKRFFAMIETALARRGTTMCASHSEALYGMEQLGVPASHLCTAVTGIDCARFHPPATPGDKVEARRRFGLPEGIPLLGTVARLSMQKDPLTLYAGVAIAMAQNPRFAFVHLGRGEFTEKVDEFLATLPAELRSRIIRIPRSEDTPSFYRALDAFVLPSRYEGFALSALEALATGLPLILTDCPGNDDLKNYPFDSLRWSKVGDSDALALNVLQWADNSDGPCNHRDVTVAKLNMKDASSAVTRFYKNTLEK